MDRWWRELWQMYVPIGDSQLHPLSALTRLTSLSVAGLGVRAFVLFSTRQTPTSSFNEEVVALLVSQVLPMPSL